MTQWVRVLILATCSAGAAGFAACARLPEEEPGVCGNHIYEPEFGEDCDGAATRLGPDATCGSPTSNAPCRLLCTRTSDPTGCPSGWGCGVDGVCRRPTAELQRGSLPGQARAVGDVDGDGRDDVIMRGPAGEAEIAFFTEGRNIAAVFVDPARRPISDAPVVQPIVARLTSDGIDDLALPLVGDDVSIRMFIGSSTRELDNPFVELVTVPDGSTGDVWMRTVFNPRGLPASICAIGGCTESLLIGQTTQDETRYAVLEDRTLIDLFRLVDGRKRQNAVLARWDHSRTCDLLAVSYRHDEDSGSPGNLVELFSLCGAAAGTYNTADPFGSITPVSSVSLADLDPGSSLILSGSADIDGDGNADLLLNVTDNDPTTADPDSTWALYGSGDGHFNSRPDQTGQVDVAELDTPLIFPHSFAQLGKDALILPTWPRAAADINADGRADFLLGAGVAALSSPNPQDECVLAQETVLRGPATGMTDTPEWGYTCVVLSDHGLLDAATVERDDITRDWFTNGSLATPIVLRGDGQPGFAAIDKNKLEVPGQPTIHDEPDILDLLWVDPVVKQLTLRSMTTERIEQVAAGDLDGDFQIDLVIGGDKLETIWGPPYELARVSSLSPAEFDVVQVFNEGRPSASMGAERDGRLTIFRDGQWPSLALTNPGDCASAKDCHVRFAVGALGDDSTFSWALGVVESSEAEGLRLLRPVSGQADLGPAYDAASVELLPLSALGFSVTAARATVLAIELDEEPGVAAIDEALLVARTDDALELAVLRPSLISDGVGDLCGPPVALAVGPNEPPQTVAVCFELVTFLSIPSEVRPHPGADDPFIEVADADDDGNLDISWVTLSNTVMLLHSDGSGTFSTDALSELVLLEADMDEPTSDEPTEPTAPQTIDWARWIELDGSRGRELAVSDIRGSGRVWTLNAHISEAELEPRGSQALDPMVTRYLGYRGDFDGDGVEDLAIGEVVLFGQPVND
jgi:hypothetical protein